MYWAPLDFDDDVRFGPPQGANVLPGLVRILLARARLLRSHPLDGCMSVGEYGDLFRGGRSSCGAFQRAGKGGALRVMGLLVESQVSLNAHPVFSLLPCERLARRPVNQS